jgi:hypothetical protein
MRKVFSVVLMAAMVCLVGMTRDAGATVTMSLIWTSTSGGGTGVGTNTITAAVGDTIQLNIVMATNQTLSVSTMTVNFDTDLANELNLIGTGSWSGSSFSTGTMATVYGQIGTASPISTTESTGASGGALSSFNSGVLSGPLFLPTGTYVIGTARFVVNGSVATDGNDLFTGLFNTAVDLFGDNTLNEIPSSALVFNGAAVNAIPEPGTVSLLGLGLVGLVLAGRRSRRS